MESNFACIHKYFDECKERHGPCIGSGMCYLKNYAWYCYGCYHLQPDDNEKCRNCIDYGIKKEVLSRRNRDYA